MDAKEIREKYLSYMKKRGHAIVPSCGLVPDNDPTTLFTSAGMQAMIPYLSGEKHPQGPRLANAPQCLRTQDIEEAGDNRHTTFCEMLGNWSRHDYFKKEQLAWMFEFLTKEVGLDPKNIYVTAFRGLPEAGIPKDEETANIWKEMFAAAGVTAAAVDFAETGGMQNGRIFYYDEKKNWWSRPALRTKCPKANWAGRTRKSFMILRRLKTARKFAVERFAVPSQLRLRPVFGDRQQCVYGICETRRRRGENGKP